MVLWCDGSRRRRSRQQNQHQCLNFFLPDTPSACSTCMHRFNPKHSRPQYRTSLAWSSYQAAQLRRLRRHHRLSSSIMSSRGSPGKAQSTSKSRALAPRFDIVSSARSTRARRCLNSRRVLQQLHTHVKNALPFLCAASSTVVRAAGILGVFVPLRDSRKPFIMAECRKSENKTLKKYFRQNQKIASQKKVCVFYNQACPCHCAADSKSNCIVRIILTGDLHPAPICRSKVYGRRMTASS